jgi:ferredoxin-type protein NapH
MKKIQILGLAIFLIGFTIFLATFFISNYKLNVNEVGNLLGEEKSSLLLEQYEIDIATTYNTNVEFISTLKAEIANVNQQLIAKYSLSDKDVEGMHRIQRDLDAFTLEENTKVFDTSTEAGQFKYDAFNSYGSWLEGRKYDSEDALYNDINNVKANIQKYGILSEFGFDQYKEKSMLYEITKVSSMGAVDDTPWLFFLLTYGLSIIGAAMYLLPKYETEGPAGIKNDGIFHSALKNKGWLGIGLGGFLITFYILLYFYPEYMTSWIITVDPLSIALKGSEAGRFFLYGFIYTLCILVMGVRMLIKYRHSKYQMLRTASVMFFQTSFAFLIPELLLRLNKPYFDFKNIWPLDYDFFFDNEIQTLLQSGGLGIFMLGWGIGLIIIGVPVFVYFFGKRWYCSWVCGCGGLAETLGDPFRQLSDKSIKAWKIERWMIHGVLVFAIVMTASVLYTYWSGQSSFLGLIDSYQLRSVYGAWIGAGFAGVIGTGFYPIMGNRVWCRFGCPLAAYLGIIQRFKSRFRITTNGGQCISCGNCSTYCEMGIDVRWYAQRGQNIVRSSCVGCGVCSSVCPRGVLNLENRDEEGRFGKPILIGNDSIKIEA